MHRIILLTLLAMVCGILPSQGQQAALFSYDTSRVSAEFDGPNWTIAVEERSVRDSSTKYEVPILGVSSFWWGFVPSCVGMCPGGCVAGLVAAGGIYYITGDAEESRKALYGCVIGQIIGPFIYIPIVSALSYW